ncbi:uncharacterized protein LOC131941391 [Physella acuta]|uniref:uncharacterized protein LOC131941391 n=1 Tax=Physella acuta TaxID=109671 RepID=UPI0027DB5403|nr:uncharacterized protein LOC131941391 [Physella acuta]
MAQLPEHLKPEWELFRNEPLKDQIRREVHQNKLDEIDRGRRQRSEFWWEAQRNVDVVVPAEFINPDSLDTFNYRYQVYARPPPVQCQPKSLAEVTDEQPPLRYNVKRIAQGKPWMLTESPCFTHWEDKPFIVECQPADAHLSRNNSCQQRRAPTKCGGQDPQEDKPSKVTPFVYDINQNRKLPSVDQQCHPNKGNNQTSQWQEQELLMRDKPFAQTLRPLRRGETKDHQQNCGETIENNTCNAESCSSCTSICSRSNCSRAGCGRNDQNRPPMDLRKSALLNSYHTSAACDQTWQQTDLKAASRMSSPVCCDLGEASDAGCFQQNQHGRGENVTMSAPPANVYRTENAVSLGNFGGCHVGDSGLHALDAGSNTHQLEDNPTTFSCFSPVADLNNNKRANSRSSVTSNDQLNTPTEGRVSKRSHKKAGEYTDQGKMDNVAKLWDVNLSPAASRREAVPRPFSSCDVRLGRRFGYTLPAKIDSVADIFTGSNVCSSPSMSDSKRLPQVNAGQDGSVAGQVLTPLTSQHDGARDTRRFGKRTGYTGPANVDSVHQLFNTDNSIKTSGTHTGAKRNCSAGSYRSLVSSDSMRNLIGYQVADINNNHHLSDSGNVGQSGECVMWGASTDICHTCSTLQEMARCPLSTMETSINGSGDHFLIDVFILDHTSQAPTSQAGPTVAGHLGGRVSRSRGTRYRGDGVSMCTNNNALDSPREHTYRVRCCPLKPCGPRPGGSGRIVCYAEDRIPATDVNKCLTCDLDTPHPTSDPRGLVCRTVPPSIPGGKPAFVCHKPARPKTPEIGYGTYKIVGGRPYRLPPPEDLLSTLKLPRKLDEYQEFIRRCPNFQVSRYDRSDPAYEMLLPANKASTLLQASLSPFVYAKNPRAGKYPPLFHAPPTGEDIHWHLPSFLSPTSQ